MNIYTPDEDTYFFLEALSKETLFNFYNSTKIHNYNNKSYNSMIIAEIGCGNSLITNTFNLPISTDINQNALKFSNSLIKIKSHLLCNLKNVDVVIFNPPYLEIEENFYDLKNFSENKSGNDFINNENNDDYINKELDNGNNELDNIRNDYINNELDNDFINNDFINNDIRYSGGIKLINEFIDMLTIPTIYLLIIKKNNPDAIKNRLENKGYDVIFINEKKILGETLIVIKGVKRR
ncbi:hypothetical protein DMUE_1843 [Dictyocoela muelleri]|nr:hypothetical protein DMUE_1843 [Dictyocoela muelleri]